MARQEPLLRWAIGEFDDGTTILATDLARGWIPPHIEIPTGVTLLTPQSTSRSMEELLRGAARIETWSPGQHLPALNPQDLVSMSVRARDLPETGEINWELTQATNWRDGLPRLAHTLAKAGTAATGVLDSEIALLRTHADAARSTVLAQYPNVDPTVLGNWQLLAAIDALVTGRRTTLNYHFAWFRVSQ